MDPGFNYAGMCQGITTRLADENRRNVLILGDGIGTLTMKCREAGIAAVYHDLADSRTMQFAKHRIGSEEFYFCHNLSIDWNPPALTKDFYDAVISLDFLEHVTDVEKWTRFVYGTLRRGGLFLAQNAFACGSGPDGSIPMHLARNDKYEKEWVPLLNNVGFGGGIGNWWAK